MEAYFSNFIEGTEFAIGEAVEIVFEGRIPESRPADGHDVLGTYLQLIELGNRSALSTDADGFIDEVQERHRNLMAQRPDILPGAFKTRPNQAGNTAFVHPDLVRGTLREGVNILRSISDPFSRALVVHFLLVDVHPFNEGNGRISRIMMTKELLAAGLSRIIIPTVYAATISTRCAPCLGEITHRSLCDRWSFARGSALHVPRRQLIWPSTRGREPMGSARTVATRGCRCLIQPWRSRCVAASQRLRTIGRHSAPTVVPASSAKLHLCKNESH